MLGPERWLCKDLALLAAIWNSILRMIMIFLWEKKKRAFLDDAETCRRRPMSWRCHFVAEAKNKICARSATAIFYSSLENVTVVVLPPSLHSQKRNILWLVSILLILQFEIFAPRRRQVGVLRVITRPDFDPTRSKGTKIADPYPTRKFWGVSWPDPTRTRSFEGWSEIIMFSNWKK